MKAIVLSLTMPIIVISYVADARAVHPPSGASDPAGADGNRLAAEPQTSTRLSRHRDRIRRAADLRRETRTQLRQEAHTEGFENLLAIENLVDLFIDLQQDTSLTDAERRRLAGTVRSRLLRVQKRLAKEHADGGAPLTQDETAVARSPHHAEGTSSEDSASMEPLAGELQLASRSGSQVAGTVAGISHLVLAQQGALGGAPAAIAAGGALGGGQLLPPDYGNDLADLIQTVIAPQTWERNGGPGSIYYYRPLRVLVIRQTSEVHDQIGGVIGGLRRAGN